MVKYPLRFSGGYGNSSSKSSEQLSNRITTKKSNVMGLFSFIKNAGEKIFGSSKEEEKAAKAEEKVAARAEANKKAAARIEETIIRVIGVIP